LTVDQLQRLKELANAYLPGANRDVNEKVSELQRLAKFLLADRCVEAESSSELI